MNDEEKLLWAATCGVAFAQGQHPSRCFELARSAVEKLREAARLAREASNRNKLAVEETVLEFLGSRRSGPSPCAHCGGLATRIIDGRRRCLGCDVMVSS